MRNLLASLICVSLLLAGCGGGGGSTASTSSSGSSGSSSSGSSSSGSSSSGSSGSGSSSSGSGSSGAGSSGSGSSGSSGTTAHNVANSIVDQGPAALNNAGIAATNVMYVNVTICAPGSTTNCQTIDHVQVDTGSQGVRIIGSVLNSSLLSALQPVAVSGGSLAECTQFVDGYSWGPIVTADVHVGGSDTATTGESAPGIPIQVIGTSTYAVPSDCSSTGGTAENTVVQFGANGIIGVGLFDQDCDPGLCGTYIDNGYYYNCSANSGCSETTVPETSEVQNPVYGLAANGGVTDNNGVIIELPAVGPNGAANLAGTLVFGIGTQSNNALPAGATILTTNQDGLVMTEFNGQSDTISYLDSGSNAIYFDDSSITACTSSQDKGFFCPASTEAFTADIYGVNNQIAPVSFSIADADRLFSNNPNNAAFNNLGGSASTAGASGAGTFAWGLPFFYGLNVYTAMENADAGGTDGPYFAF
jgi:Protein of unknown function (DUF3443)